MVSVAESRYLHRHAYGVSEQSAGVCSAERAAREHEATQEDLDLFSIGAEPEEDEDMFDRRGRHGSEHRQARSFFFKRRVLSKLEDFERDGVTNPHSAIALLFGINKSCVSAWKKKREWILGQCMQKKKLGVCLCVCVCVFV